MPADGAPDDPKHPDFGGLQIYLSHLPDGAGNMKHGDWDKFLSEELKIESNTMKQFLNLQALQCKR